MVWLLAALAGLGSRAADAPAPMADDETFEIEALAPGEVIYSFQEGGATVVITNDFVVRFRDATLTARGGVLDEAGGTVSVEGAVTLQRDDQVWRGERLRYHFRTRAIETSEFRAGKWPVYAAGQGLALDLTNRVYVATNAYLTADDVAIPGFRVGARRLKIAPGKYFEARHAVLYAGNVPVFYFPYLRRNLDRYSNHFNAVPGYRSRFGAYLLGSYEWYWTERFNGVAHLDYRSKRGFGGGLDVSYDGGRWGRNELQTYYVHDLGTDEVLGFEGEEVEVDRDRHRLSFAHQSEPWTNLTVKLAYRPQSDAYVLRDFFETEYRGNTQPTSFLEVGRQGPNLTLSLLAQPQVNDFYETIERLPDLKLTAARQQLWALPVYYEGEGSAGYLRHNYAAGSTNGVDYAAMRADTFHQLLLPATLFGWLNLTPRVGGRLTYYGDTEGPEAVWGERTRWVFNTGMELSFKASRLWARATNRVFGIDGVRHVLQPSLNYAYVPEPSVLPEELPQFDYELPSLRLLPNQFPEYHAIDSVQGRNVLRLGLRNKLQTKRGGQVDNLLNWDLYTDWHVEGGVGGVGLLRRVLGSGFEAVVVGDADLRGAGGSGADPDGHREPHADAGAGGSVELGVWPSLSAGGSGPGSAVRPQPAVEHFLLQVQ